MKDSKNIVIGLLCAVVCIMAVAYAAFATTLNINGTATISSTWDVAITAISCEATEVTGGEAVAVTQGFDRTTATFNMKFQQPGDTGQCLVTITNNGDLNAKVSAITINNKTLAEASTELGTGAIQYAVSGINVGTTLAAKGTNTYIIDAEFVDNNEGAVPSDAEKTKTLTVTIDYVQDLGA